MPEEETKKCPYCAEEIKTDAIKCKHCGSMVATTPSGPLGTLDSPVVGAPTGADDLLSGRYRIIRELGRGGMGVVYLAHDEELDMEVAIKSLPIELAKDSYSLEQLRAEAKLSMSLSHPNIMRLHNLDTSGPIKFLVMEYVDGKTLLDIIRERNGLPFEEALPIIKSLCEGVDYAHSRRVLHRDLKPANIMLTSKGEVKIADFGIARQMKESMTQLSQKTVSGTPAYMAPEHIMGEHLTVRSDIYSLGSVVYEILTGRPPFYEGDVISQIRYKKPLPIATIPSTANKAILAALAKRARDRPASAAEFYKALARGRVSPGGAATFEKAPVGPHPVQPQLVFRVKPQQPSPPIKKPKKVISYEKLAKASLFGKPDAHKPVLERKEKNKIPLLLIAAGAVCVIFIAAVVVLILSGGIFSMEPAQDTARSAQEPAEPEETTAARSAQEPAEPARTAYVPREREKPELTESRAESEKREKELEAERRAEEERERMRREREAEKKKEEEIKKGVEAAKWYLDQEHYKDAAKAARGVLALNPDDPTAKKLLARATSVICVPEDYATIQEAIDNASAGKVIVVADGTYKGKGNKDINFKGKAITVKSRGGPDACIIDCQGSGRGFYFNTFETNKSVLKGFTIKNGNGGGTEGGGIYCTGKACPTIINCKIINNRANNGGAISCWNRSSPKIINCLLANNSVTGKGGAVNCWNNSGPELINCTVVDNSSEKCGGGVAASERSRPKLHNTIIWGNKVTKANEETTQRKPRRRPRRGSKESSPEFQERDIKGHEIFTYDSASTVTLQNCCMPYNTYEYNSYSGEGRTNNRYSTSNDPDFEDPTRGNYRLIDGSPCIDRGNNEYLPENVTTDLAGKRRKAGSDSYRGRREPRVDIGAYEYQQ